MSIPSLLVLRAAIQASFSSDSEPTEWSICERFLPGLTKSVHFSTVLDSVKDINSRTETLLERFVLEIDDSSEEIARLRQVGQTVKHLGMELQRKDAAEWNQFMTACLNNSE